MTTVSPIHARVRLQEPPDELDVADDLVPVVGVVFQAGPPAYVIAAFGVVITLLACFPLMILAVILAMGLAMTTLLAALVVVPVHLARASRERWAHRAHGLPSSASWAPATDAPMVPARVPAQVAQRSTP
jgi:hypothetical protein